MSRVSVGPQLATCPRRVFFNGKISTTPINMVVRCTAINISGRVRSLSFRCIPLQHTILSVLVLQLSLITVSFFFSSKPILSFAAIFFSAGFQVLTTVVKNIALFWDIVP
jgi:hypothetical protein